MAIYANAIEKLTRMFGRSAAMEIVRLASEAETIERKNRRTIQAAIDQITDAVITELERTDTIPKDYVQREIEGALVAMGYRTISQALGSAHPVSGPQRLAKKPPPKGPMPKSIRALMELWDQYRHRRKIPKREREIARRVASAYIKKVQSVWNEATKDFREGRIADREIVVQRVKEATKASHARAATIANTETTRYYNAARRTVYDASDDVTHYLFVAIRDARTTKWCKTRDGIVYKKGDAVTDRETPPIHWSCRSEVLPLTPLNPAHAKLIQDKRLARANRSPAPLPKGWNQG